MGKAHTIAIGIMLCLGVVTAYAEPFVIEDTGRSEPITPYLDAMKGGGPTQNYSADMANAFRMAPPAVDYEAAQFPVHTPEMTPGTVILRRVNIAQMVQPVCMVGSDDRSIAWLQQHAARLAQLGAVCMVIEANTLDEFKRVQQAAPQIPMQAVSGSTIAKQFNVRHYPVLVSQSFIEQ